MSTTLPNAEAEGIVQRWTGVDIWVALNTGDPGKTGANLATGVGRRLIASADGWSAFDNDTDTGGRVTKNEAVIDFGNSTASGGETYTHASLWSAATGGTYRGGAPLENPVTVGEGEGVTIPIGKLEMVGSGIG